MSHKMVAGLSVVFALLSASGCVAAQSSAETAAVHSPAAQAQTGASAPLLEPYALLTPLVGDWDTAPGDGAPIFVQYFSWGPGQGSIWYRTALLNQGGEHLHFEGPIVWNAATRKFDYLFVVEPGSLGQEQGQISFGADGEIVREVALTNADGSVEHFRQFFRPLGPGRYETALFRHGEAGWAPNFPGSDHLVMTRRGQPAR